MPSGPAAQDGSGTMVMPLIWSPVASCCRDGGDFRLNWLSDCTQRIFVSEDQSTIHRTFIALGVLLKIEQRCQVANSRAVRRKIRRARRAHGIRKIVAAA